MSGLLSKMSPTGKLAGGATLAVAGAYVLWKWTKGVRPPRDAASAAGAGAAGAGVGAGAGAGDKKESRTLRAAVVDRKFFTKLKSLLAIAVPSWYCEETGYLSVLLVFLIGRTFLSIRISEVNGSIVKAIVERNFLQFLSRLGVLASIAVPASTINAALKYLGNKAALAFRKRLVRHFHELYLQPMMYYRVLNLDNRISNPDQALTETMEKWGKSLSDLYSNVTKPLFDIVLFSRKLSDLVGVQGPLSVLLYYFVSGFVIKLISPSFGKLTAEAQRLEGQFRYCHNRLITHSEEIAFYGGHVREKNVINENFAAICAHMEVFFRKLFYQGIFDGFLVKYGAVMLGYAVLGLPVFGPNSEEYAAKVGDDAAMITHDYIRNSSLLINLARAIGRIVTSYKELQKLAGYTALVAELQDVLTDLSLGKYRRRMVKGDKALDESKLRPGSGTVISNADDIVFEGVPIVTPNGDLLAPDVTFHIRPKQNLMIVGPNGCGKSSLFRILGELWPLWGGVLRKPAFKDLFYIPQKPYLAIGTLRQQIIYPDSVKDMHDKKFSDADLYDLLASVKLQELVDKRKHTGSWDAVEDWADVLSGGEKQRVAMARLFYHKPKYAILDECTSAVSVDVEAFMYVHCRQLGISLITISHRPSLWKHHEWILRFDGRGAVTFDKMVLPDSDVP